VVGENLRNNSIQDLKELTGAIRLLEEKLLAPETRHSVADLDDLLSDDFIEFGRSGNVYNKQVVLDRIRKEETARMTLSDFKVAALAPEVVLATYYATKTAADGQISYSLRSSIWRKTGEKWKMFFHQGTAAGVKS
jgi:hypothetical protein